MRARRRPDSDPDRARGATRPRGRSACAAWLLAAMLLVPSPRPGQGLARAEGTPAALDPWQVVDAWIAVGRRAEAVALAADVEGPEATALRRWVAQAAVREEDLCAREAVGQAERERERGAPSAALARLDACRAGTSVLLARAFQVRALALEDLGRPEEAAAAHVEAAGIAERDGRLGFAAASSRAGAAAEARAGRAEAEVRALERAAALYAQAGDGEGEAEALAALGRARDHRGDILGAIVALRRAVALEDQRGPSSRVAADTLRALGLVALRAGEHEEAMEAQTRALARSEADGDRGGSAAALGNLGDLHWRTGAYARSLACQERALALLEELGDGPRVAATLCNLGVVHQRLGDEERALACYERALSRLEEVGDLARMATVLVNVGSLHATRGEPERALAVLDRARRAAEAAGDRAGVAAALTNEGYVFAGLGNSGEAERAHTHALGTAESVGDREGAVEMRTALGLVEAARGDPERALTLLRRAVEDAETLGAEESLVAALWATAAVRLQAGEGVESADAARRAIEELPIMVAGLGDEQGAQARRRLAPVFETGLRAAALLDDPVRATYFLESGRAGSLLEALGGRDRLDDVVVPAGLRAAEAAARAAEALALAHYRRALDGDDLAVARAGRAEHEAARQGVRRAIERIQREAKAAAHLVYPRAADLDELQDALGPDQALVEYAVLPSRVLALVITKTGARIVPLCAPEELDALCRGLEGLAARGPDPSVHVRALRAAVIRPLTLPAVVTRVLVSPDGPLAFVPFPMLLEGREVALVPSGTTWLLLREDRALRGVGVLALGDPAYDVDGPGVNSLARMSSGVGFPALPHTRVEAQGVGDVVLLGADATEAGLRFAVTRRARWRAVHLACHGVIDTAAPLLSALALTPSGTDDGFLTALDVLSSRIPADLVVLSACRTGRGAVVRGEGVVGFVRAFMFAGSPRVVVSLWNGDDEATSLLMTTFHRALARGRPTARALLDAQEAVRRQPRWGHPYYWAGWVLWGLPD